MEVDSNEIVVMQQMQWQRVKGELRALCCGSYASSLDSLNEAVDKFVADVEDNEQYVS